MLGKQASTDQSPSLSLTHSRRLDANSRRTAIVRRRRLDANSRRAYKLFLKIPRKSAIGN